MAMGGIGCLPFLFAAGVWLTAGSYCYCYLVRNVRNSPKTSPMKRAWSPPARGCSMWHPAC